jgi:putative lipoprotein
VTRVLAALLCLLVAGACGERTPPDQPPNPAAPPIGTIRGTVSYRERVALTNRAVLELTLEDVSRQDVAAPVIAAKSMADPGQVPIRFELDFPSGSIDPRLAYALRARITDGGRLLFTTDPVVPVLTRGAGREVRLVLARVVDDRT